jgi:glutathione S-transferase
MLMMPLPRLKLVSHKLCPYVQRARIVLEEKSIPHDLEFIDLANKPQWFLELSPLGKVPVLLVDDEPLFESAPIAEYLDEVTPGSLHPSDPFQKAQHRAWVEFASNTLGSIAAFYNARDIVSFGDSITTLRDRFQRLEAQLGVGPYFNGPDFSLVDAAFGPVFRYFDVIENYGNFEFFADRPKVMSWRSSLNERQSIQQAAVHDYAQRLHRFFLERKSLIANLISWRQPVRV